MKTPLRLVALALGVGVIFVFMAACDWEGDTFNMDLTNDTQEPLEFRLCTSTSCNRILRERRVESGEHFPATNTVGFLSYWQVQDEEGGVLGCFKIDFKDARPLPELRTLYVSKDLVPCP